MEFPEWIARAFSLIPAVFVSGWAVWMFAHHAKETRWRESVHRRIDERNNIVEYIDFDSRMREIELNTRAANRAAYELVSLTFAGLLMVLLVALIILVLVLSAAGVVALTRGVMG